MDDFSAHSDLRLQSWPGQDAFFLSQREAVISPLFLLTQHVNVTVETK